MANNHSYKASIKKLAGSKIEIESEIPADEFAAHIKDVVDEAVREAEIKGFRKGGAPEKLVKEKIGVDVLLREAASSAISHAYGHIIDAEKIDAVGRPEVAITKIAEGNPLCFKLTTAVIPEIKNFDYKGIAKKENEKKREKVAVTEKELAETIEVILKNYGQATKAEKVPKLSDELVKKIRRIFFRRGFQKETQRKHGRRKGAERKGKRRLALIDALTAEMSLEIPDILVESELERIDFGNEKRRFTNGNFLGGVSETSQKDRG